MVSLRGIPSGLKTVLFLNQGFEDWLNFNEQQREEWVPTGGNSRQEP